MLSLDLSSCVWKSDLKLNPPQDHDIAHRFIRWEWPFNLRIINMWLNLSYHVHSVFMRISIQLIVQHYHSHLNSCVVRCKGVCEHELSTTPYLHHNNIHSWSVFEVFLSMTLLKYHHHKHSSFEVFTKACTIISQLWIILTSFIEES